MLIIRQGQWQEGTSPQLQQSPVQLLSNKIVPNKDGRRERSSSDDLLRCLLEPRATEGGVWVGFCCGRSLLEVGGVSEAQHCKPDPAEGVWWEGLA